MEISMKTPILNSLDLIPQWYDLFYAYDKLV